VFAGLGVGEGGGVAFFAAAISFRNCRAWAELPYDVKSQVSVA
jgi:hypothetical protein